MEWDEVKVLHAQKRREALAVTQSARAVKDSGERSTAPWTTWLWLYSLLHRPDDRDLGHVEEILGGRRSPRRQRLGEDHR